MVRARRRARGVCRGISGRAASCAPTSSATSGTSRAGAGAQRIAVVQATEIYSNIFALPGALLAGVPARIGSRRGINPDRTRGQVALQRARLRVRAPASSPTRRRRPTSCAASACRERKIAVVPNGLDFAPFAAARSRAPLAAQGHGRRQPAAAQRPRRARSTPRSRSCERFPDARFDIIGEGPGARRADRARRGRTASRTPSRSPATAATSRRGSPTPTSSCCPRARNRFRTRFSKRWPPGCRSSPPASAAFSSWSTTGAPAGSCRRASPKRSPAASCHLMERRRRRRAARRRGARRRGRALLVRAHGRRLRRHSYLTELARRGVVPRRPFRTGGLLTCAALLESCRSTGSTSTRHRARCGCATSSPHRGPDEAGLHCDAHAALAHRRLSIVDLELRPAAAVERRRQRLGRVQRRDLQPRARSARSSRRAATSIARKSDTETIVHAYEQWGEDCVHRFRGMFAFAIWDAPKRRLLLVRDRLGIKPLYWARTPDSAAVRIGDQGDSRERPDRTARANESRAAGGAEHALHVRRRDDVPRHPQAAAGHLLVFEGGADHDVAVLGRAGTNAQGSGPRLSGHGQAASALYRVSGSCSRSRCGCG